MLSALGNVWKIPELRQKITFTLIMFAIFRMGTHIPVPGVDPTAIEQLFANGNLFGLLDLFSGGAFSKFSIFAMSITPYINAAIIIQLLNVVIPTLEQWSKEGQEGHKKTTQVTRYLTVVLAFFQAIGMSIGLKAAILNPSPVNILIIAITLTAGTVFLMWLGEQITANGVGNGISLIIFAGIVAALPKNIGTIYHYVQAGTISYFSVFMFALIAIAMVVFVVHVENGFRRIPISYTKRVGSRGTYGGHSSHIPLKVNQAGVIPIIFASSVLMFPVTIAQFIDIPWVKTIASYLEWGKPLQTTLYVGMIIFFTYFYASITYNPREIADNLKKNGGFIPGIRPGAPTSDYLKKTSKYVITIGAIMLAFIAIFPILLQFIFGIDNLSISGSSLMIAIGVALETVKQIESQMVMRHYKGFLSE